ncbi:MAG: hypothetical protein KDK71_05900 [Chlamydiia bacterium]|nr:hypothetical protein [Chlamydiia bacterium]
MQNSQKKPREILLEGKASYFVSTNEKFRDIYGGTGLYRIEANIQVWKDLYTWVSLGYMYGWGDSSRGNHTHIHVVPLSFGVNYLFKLENWTPYAGIGPILAYSYIHNGSHYVTRHQNGWGGGFQTKLGSFVSLTERLFLDLFADYSFIRMSFNHSGKRTYHHKGDLSGFSFGAGLGYRF